MVLPVPVQFAGQALSDAQTVSWAQQGGFTGDDLITAVAVSFAENSSRRIDAVHTNSDGSKDYGEWQINDRAHADLFTRWPNWWSVSNADMAHAVFSSSGWGAWTTYATGDYRKQIGRASAAVQQAAANGILQGSPFTSPGTNDQNANDAKGQVDTNSIFTDNPLTNLANGVIGIAQKVFKAGGWLGNPHNWVRVAMVVLGGAAIIGGVLFAVKGEFMPPGVSAMLSKPAAGKVT